jgi:hypothetical protein
MPFGGNVQPFGEEQHPIHGETANEKWSLVHGNATEIEMSLSTRVREANVTKQIHLVPGHLAVYSRHIVANGVGPMTIGHHAMVKFSSEGHISTSPFGFGQVFPGQFENPREGGYSTLKPGARFTTLSEVPKIDQGTADLSRYPARDGFEDIAMIYAEKRQKLGWSAVVFPEEGYVWYSLKDSRVLSGTVFWHSNGGRHYAPWSGRHRAVLGLEEVTAAMHAGLAESVAANDASREGYATYIELETDKPLVVNTIIGVASIPNGFDVVSDLKPAPNGITMRSKSGLTATASLDLGHLAID